jgi:hypothetical protein
LVVTRPPIAQADSIRSNTPPDGCNCCGECDNNPFNISVDDQISKDKSKQNKFRPSFDKVKTFINSSVSNLYGKRKTLKIVAKDSVHPNRPDEDNLEYVELSKESKFGRNDGTGIYFRQVRQNDDDDRIIVEGPFDGDGPSSWDPEAPHPTVPCFKHVPTWLDGNYDDPIHSLCNRTCCKAEKYSTSVSGSEPIFFAYKYSGCHLTWYPREFSFDKDPYVSQCNGVLTEQEKCVNPQNGCSVTQYQRSQNSCSGWALQRNGIGSAGNAYHVEECSAPYNNNIFYIKTDLKFPCACVPFPHIHGGFRDSLQNRINVRLSPGQMGYVSKMNPFDDPMIGEIEAGCCWCANTQQPPPSAFDDYAKSRAACYRQTYPYWDGKGKRPGNISPCDPGFRCHYREPTPSTTQFDNYLLGNPKYRQHCYEWGISPYLLRISTRYHRMGLEIFKHGRYGGYLHDFGNSFEVTRIEPNQLLRDIEISFSKKVGKKTTLREQYIGFVQLEHHFECYAFRSPEGTRTVEMKAIQNHCSLLIEKSERGYAGKYVPRGGNCYRWTPWPYDSILWQVKRSVPRRVMYAGSGIPIFHFDLVAMEQKLLLDPTLSENCPAFTPEKFLENYYRYFFGMTLFSGKGCTEFNRPPEPLEWDYRHLVSSRDYVTCWLEKMIECGILRIKDHAIDIAKETNDIIAAGITVTDSETGEEEIFIPEQVANECGGIEGYQQLLDFWGVEAGAANAITPRMVKEKLYNPAGVSRTDNDSTMINTGSVRMFLPRRAKLPLGNVKAGITAWGCFGGFSAQNQYEDFTCPSYVGPNNPNGPEYGDALKIPTIFNVPHPEDSEFAVFNILRHDKVYTNFSSTILRDGSGKINGFGGIPRGEIEDDYLKGDMPCDLPIEDIIGGRLGMYPGSIQCIPPILTANTLFSTCTDDSGNPYTCPANPLDIWDGRVKDICFTHKLAVAMCEFDRNAFGYACCLPNEPGAPILNPAYEYGEIAGFELYSLYNCNGSNVGIGYPGLCPGPLCYPNEPFHIVGCGPGVISGARAEMPEPPYQGNRLKSWGSWSALYGTFSLCYEDALLYGGDYTTEGQGIGVPRRGYYPQIHGTTFDGSGTERQLNYRYPGTNTWHIWTKIGCGLFHFAALDDYGGLFITPRSSNAEGQASHGIPLEYNSIYNNLTGAYSYNHFGAFYNYYNHIPKPGFIKDGEWSQLRYNVLTAYSSSFRLKHCVCSPFVADWGDVPSYCEPDVFTGSSNQPCSECFNTAITTFDGTIPQNDQCGNCYGPITGWRDLTCYYMGSYVQANGAPSNEAYTFAFSETQPHYKDLACGTFNTMVLTNENKIEIYGTYYQINENGLIIGPKIEEFDENGEVVNTTLIPVPCFVPQEVLNLKGTWDVTYACPMNCASFSAVTEDNDGNPLPECWSGITFSPIIGATYNPPNFENRIKIIKSSADYSLCVTNSNKVYIWGESSMIPGYNKDTYYPGTTRLAILDKEKLGVPQDNDYEITHVAAGIHSVHIAYKIIIPNSSYVFNKIYTFKRYGNETIELDPPGELQGKEIISLSSGNGFSIALYGEGIEAKTWDAASFADESRVEGWQLKHLDYQYKNFNSLPPLHKRDAYFHAIKGNWDFSKWLWGGNCCNAINNPDHPSLLEDRCSALAYNIYMDPSVYGYDYTGVSDSIVSVKPPNANNSGEPGLTFVNINIVEDTNGFTSGQRLYISARMPPTGATLSFGGTVFSYTGQTLSITIQDLEWLSEDNDYGWDPLKNTAGGQVRGENDVWDIKLDTRHIFNKNLSYSGHPELLWMRPDIRRLTEQALTQLKNLQSAFGPLQGSNCTPGGIFDMSSTDSAGIAALYGGCLADLGMCWGEARPLAADGIRYEQQIPFEDCPPGDACDPGLKLRNRGVVCQSVDPPCPLTAYGVDSPSPEAFRSDKDNFQKVVHRYGPRRIGRDLCYEHAGKQLSYFKYCERHYYMGYDSDKDTWEIYETPDILRNFTTNSIEGLTFYLWQDGPTGATVSQPSNGGFGDGNSGPENLSNYPGTGPNYARKDWVYWPTFFLGDANLATTIVFNVCAIDTNNPCLSPCLGAGLIRNKIYQLLRIGGIGAFVWATNCNSANTIFADSGDVNTMWNRYITFNALHFTLTPSTILWGVSNDIGPVLPPDEDPNFQKKGFLKVLVDEQYTARYEPYRDTSDKWHPLCWESASDVGNNRGLPGSVNCFAGVDQDYPCMQEDENVIIYYPETNNGFTKPASCLLYECCPPPD